MNQEFVPHTLIYTLRHEPDRKLYIGFLATDPSSIVEGETAKLQEVAYDGYRRQPVSLVFEDPPMFVRNRESFTFPKPPVACGFLSHFAIFDSPDEERPQCIKSLGFVMQWAAGEPITVDAGGLRLYVGDTNPSVVL